VKYDHSLKTMFLALFVFMLAVYVAGFSLMLWDHAHHSRIPIRRLSSSAPASLSFILMAIASSRVGNSGQMPCGSFLERRQQ
jgi:hypothetical protein